MDKAGLSGYDSGESPGRWAVKGFPNQVAELGKLEVAIRCVARLADAGDQPRDDGVLGEELVRAGVAGTGHRPMPVEEYIRAQRIRPRDRQSFRTTARGLRELFRLLGFIVDTGETVSVTTLGRQAAVFADAPENAQRIPFWRSSIREMTHSGGDTAESHPYQVLLRLVARRPGITRAKCALALEARDDSQAELDRIVALSRLSEPQIIRDLHITKATWDNAKKVLPKFAEQLGDVARTGDTFRIADAPGRAGDSPVRTHGAVGVRAPRTSRQVTARTIGRAGTADDFDEVAVHADLDQTAADAAIDARRRRLRQHNLLLQRLAVRLAGAGASLHENPFDILALFDGVGVLGEVKTLDGTVADERSRVREALSQLLYYQAFLLPPVAGAAEIRMVACFTRQISEDHVRWLNAQGIAVIWRARDGFGGDLLAAEFLGPHIQELRR